MSSELPPALRPWAESLAFLSVEAALHIGPLVRRLDALVRRHDATHAAQGEPDGYGGLTTRGHPERLLLSEWLLAEELPLEFLRRAASRELLHINPTFRTPQPEGSVAVFCDAGPDQLGAARLVQLAALIVLNRRARTRGSELLVGLSGQPADLWHGGELPEQYAAWRAARNAFTPTRDELDDRDGVLDDAAELWVLAGPALAASVPAHALLLTTIESAWDERGATAVDVRFERRTTTLAVPPGSLSVRTLRGGALRRELADPSSAGTGAFSCPSFSSGDRRLLLRGDRPDVLIAVSVPTNRRGGAARPRTHVFSGPVLAASSFGGRRLVALVLGHDDRVRCEVVGKALGLLDRIEIELGDLEVGRDELRFDELPPLYYDGGDLRFSLAGEWWWVHQAGIERDTELVAIAPTRQLDLPYKVWAYDVAPPAVAGDHVCAHQRGSFWRVRGRGIADALIDVEGEHTVLGLLTRGREQDPALVTVSQDGRLVRLRTASEVKTLTACSGPALARALHPGLGLLAIQHDEEHVDVRDLLTGDIVVTVQAQ